MPNVKISIYQLFWFSLQAELYYIYMFLFALRRSGLATLPSVGAVP